MQVGAPIQDFGIEATYECVSLVGIQMMEKRRRVEKKPDSAITPIKLGVTPPWDHRVADSESARGDLRTFIALIADGRLELGVGGEEGISAQRCLDLEGLLRASSGDSLEETGQPGPSLASHSRIQTKIRPRRWAAGFYGVISIARQWDVFDRYGRFVKEIFYAPDVGRVIDPTVYVRLACRSVLLLPNLLRFQCGQVWPSASEAILYMRPSLQIIELQDTPSAAMLLALPALITGGAQPRKLIFRGQFVATVIVRLPFHHLTTLELKSAGDFNIPLLHGLGRLPHLQSLSISSGCFPADFVPELPADPAVPFPQLRCAQFLWEPSGPRNGSSFPLFMLKKIDSWKVQSLVLRWMPEMPVRRVADTAPSSCSESHTRFNLVNDGHIAAIVHHSPKALQELDFSATVVSAIDLEPLGWGWFHALRRLTLSGTYTFQFGCPFDSHFEGLTQLRFLSVRFSLVSTRRSSTSGKVHPFLISILTLAKIARRCPKLHEVEVALSPINLPAPPKTPPYFTHLLRKLVVHSTDSPFDALAVARHLDHFFPLLGYVRFDGGSDEREYLRSQQAWVEVQRLVFAFQEVREISRKPIYEIVEGDPEFQLNHTAQIQQINCMYTRSRQILAAHLHRPKKRFDYGIGHLPPQLEGSNQLPAALARRASAFS
ncbi:hypothetical protein FB45DRAFT_1004530 [Roridomyces roridus]|uniref:Uncharacterized protein n=1 Tax=Roridomyces roridus TaxID=1738132 RepID=A0AAD7FLF6_9AGAR|nr:hypothetical protein FB45DRAFT_1004530 [Roridomyces roridus]